ncbi:hypothetical protein [Actinomycetospora atypica]|uniref:Carrier domain-containing protein n=1 Tax=Actinomycetospora atypica TaxID=1290095 RepID=A0ABV9YEB4_9PSEU
MIDEQALLEVMVEAIAEAMAVEVSEVLEALEAVGGEDNLELDSRVAEWVVAHVESSMPEVGRLPAPANLEPHQIGTLGALRRAMQDALIQQAG